MNNSKQSISGHLCTQNRNRQLNMNQELLLITLDAAVPLWVVHIQKEAWDWDRVLAEARKAGQVVAEKGDIIQYRSKQKGETAVAFNELAKGLACMSFVPGGVRFCGRHWDNKLGK